MAKPEGYRKAMRLMRLAERARMPVIAFIDTPGAYPGPDAEQRGQAQAIAESISLMFELTVPVIAIVIGEGGSGGALAIGVADRVLMLEYSIYSVISPESCASILWSDSTLAERASEKLKMNPSDLRRLKVIDDIIQEPQGGAHRDPQAMAKAMQKALLKQFGPLVEQFLRSPSAEKSRHFAMERRKKFRALGDLALAHAPTEKEEHSPERGSSS
jgi:acetyl-CoA carboxylase carboxyl transferase subunit alpha